MKCTTSFATNMLPSHTLSISRFESKGQNIDSGRHVACQIKGGVEQHGSQTFDLSRTPDLRNCVERSCIEIVQ